MIIHEKMNSLTFWENNVQPPQGRVWTNHPDRYLLALNADCAFLYTKIWWEREMEKESCETTQHNMNENYKA